MTLFSPWRADFPIFSSKVNGEDLIYLDSAATAQKPGIVLDRLNEFYKKEYSSVHRGAHYLSAVATESMESVRDKVAQFLGAGNPRNIVFTKGTTEAINLVANTFTYTACQPRDEIIITEMEHHANIVPWQILAEKHDVTLLTWPLRDDGTLSTEDLKKLISERTKLISFTHISNVMGTINPVKQICQYAQSRGISTFVDGAQAAMHGLVDVMDLGCDFYTFSAHKAYGPSGIGALFISNRWIDKLPPWEGGGAMIEVVSLSDAPTFQEPPWRFEAGTPNIAGIIGMGSAIHYLETIGLERVQKYEKALLRYALEKLEKEVESIRLFRPPIDVHTSVISFNLGDHHAFDVGSFLDKYGIAIRTGHHCAMPLLKRYGINSLCRVSLALYNESADIDALVNRLARIEKLLS